MDIKTLADQIQAANDTLYVLRRKIITEADMTSTIEHDRLLRLSGRMIDVASEAIDASVEALRVIDPTVTFPAEHRNQVRGLLDALQNDLKAGA